MKFLKTFFFSHKLWTTGPELEPPSFLAGVGAGAAIFTSWSRSIQFWCGSGWNAIHPMRKGKAQLHASTSNYWRKIFPTCTSKPKPVFVFLFTTQWHCHWLPAVENVFSCRACISRPRPDWEFSWKLGASQQLQVCVILSNQGLTRKCLKQQPGLTKIRLQVFAKLCEYQLRSLIAWNWGMK